MARSRSRYPRGYWGVDTVISRREFTIDNQVVKLVLIVWDKPRRGYFLRREFKYEDQSLLQNDSFLMKRASWRPLNSLEPPFSSGQYEGLPVWPAKRLYQN
jgi:hypothetical protein